MFNNSDKIDITVLIPTYNRATDLEETLAAMCLVERDGLSVEFVVIDNNSSDNTKKVVESYSNCLPLRYLFEKRTGKNCALNKALNEVQPGDIVVFTDDDVTPRSNWLKEIKGACERWKDINVFGGVTIGVWSSNNEPKWLRYTNGTFNSWNWNKDLGQTEMIYTQGRRPHGTNFWIRRSLFDKGLRFNESIGPSPVNRAMGSETSLLLLLARDGQKMVHCPNSVVLHRLQKFLASSRGIRKRAYSFGRGLALLSRFPQNELRLCHRNLWWLRQIAAAGLAALRLLFALMSITKARRTGKSLEPISDMAFHIELLKMDFSGTQGILIRQNSIMSLTENENSACDKILRKSEVST